MAALLGGHSQIAVLGTRASGPTASHSCLLGVWGGRAIKRLEEEEVRVSEDFELSWVEGMEKEGDRCEER